MVHRTRALHRVQCSCASKIALLVKGEARLRVCCWRVYQEREDAGLSDWDRFARAEYVRLALEEEGDAEDGDTKILDEPWCARFFCF